MQVKRFVAANMRLALNMVREDIGPDAVILSNKRVPGGVEILTAVETGELPVGADSTDVTSNNQNPFEQVSSGNAMPKPKERSKLEIGVEDMQLEAKARAEAVAASLAQKNREQLAAVVSANQAEPKLDTEKLSPEVVEFNSIMAMASASSDQENNAASVSNIADISIQQLAPKSELPEKTGLELSQMRFELQSMRDLLEQQLTSMAWGQFNQQNPKQAGLWRRLKRMGIGAVIANNLLVKKGLDNHSEADSSNNNWQEIMADLSQKLPVVGSDLISKGGVFAFVGPTGAGKTTTIGKLAARYVLANGADSIALVTTDTMRIAAHEQLRTFGRILNVPVNIVDKYNSLERVLYSLRHKALVLVDTAGLNRQDERLKPQLANLNEQGTRLKTILVLPTTSQVEVIKSAYHTYKTDNLECCVLTKLDETASLGEALTLAIDNALPVAYSTNGQGIPNDIAQAKAGDLVKHAIELAKQIRVDDDSMADELSVLSKKHSNAAAISAVI
jgi:flagellar biosynthesis protein FlhF